MINRVPRKWQIPLTWKASAVFAGLAFLTALILFTSPGTPTTGNSDIQEYFQLRKGPFDIVVTESGVIKAREKVIIKSEVEGTTTILWVIEEGKQVKKGELLLDLDASNLQSAMVDQEILVDNAEASYISARENLAVVKNQTESDLNQAELTLRFAKQDLKKYTEGEYPHLLKEQESNIILKKEVLRRAQEKLDWSRKLHGEKYLSATELDGDVLAVRKGKIELDLANQGLRLLTDYTYQRTVAELESNVRQTQMALERSKRKAVADVVQAEAGLRAKKSQFQQEKNKLDKLKNQLAKTRIYAPTDGLVIYATTARNFMRNKPPLATGQEVKERQELIYLPRSSSMLAEIMIPEVSLHKINIGLPVRVMVDALPGKEFEGKLVSISPLPDSKGNWFNENLKLYPAVIHLEENIEGLRTGMSCQAEILVQHYDEVLFAPIQTVVQNENRSFVYLEGRPSPVEVETGLDNNIMIRMISGVKAGDRLLLTPPY